MSNSGNQGQQQGFHGNTGVGGTTGNAGFNTAPTPNGGNPSMPSQQQQNNTNGMGTAPPVMTSYIGGSTTTTTNVNTNVPTPGGGAGGNQPATSASSTANNNTSLVPMTATTTTAEGTSTTQSQGTVVNPQQQQQQQQAKELNAASLCRYGQETVQEIVSRTQELYQTLRGAQPPDGKQQTQAMDRKPKFQETLRNIRGLYKRLRVIYDKIEESFPTSTDLNLDERIPYVCGDDDDNSSYEPMNEKRDTEAYHQAIEEYEEVKDMVIFKNRHLRETMDLMRNIIWDINTMLAMRKE